MSKTEHTPEYLLSLNELRNLALPDEARSRIRLALAEYADFHTVSKKALRGVSAPGLFGRIASPRRWYAGIAALVLVMGGMGGTAYASETTLPGDLLYPVKISVAEPVELAFAGSLEHKASLHATLAERRLEEAAKLAVKQDLKPSTGMYLEQKFSEHVDKTLAAADELQASGKVDESLSVRSDLEARLVAHNDILGLVANHLAAEGGNDATLATTESLLHTVALRREVVTDTRVALENDRESSVSKSDTLAIVTKATDSGAVSATASANANPAVSPAVTKHMDDATFALTEAQISLEGDQPQDARRAFRKAQEAARSSEVATILLKNGEILAAAGPGATATTTATTTPAVATTTPAAEPHK